MATFKFRYEETRFRTIEIDARDGLEAFAKLNKMAEDGIETDEADFLCGKVTVPLEDRNNFRIEMYGEIVKDINATDFVVAEW